MFLIEPRDEKICFCKLENKGSAQLGRKCMFIYFATDSISQNFITPKVKASSHNLWLISSNLCLLLLGSPNTGFLKALLTFHSDLSRVVRKPAFCICENKDADQLLGDREADQRLCFRYTDSTIPLLPKSEISNL